MSAEIIAGRTKKIPVGTSWAPGTPTIIYNAFFEIEAVMLEKIVLDNSEHRSRGLTGIIGNSAASSEYFAWCASWPRRTPRC